MRKVPKALEGRREQERLEFEDARTVVDTLIGSAIGDQQVRRLLGVLPIPKEEQIEARAERTVAPFLGLFGRGRSTQ